MRQLLKIGYVPPIDFPVQIGDIIYCWNQAVEVAAINVEEFQISYFGSDGILSENDNLEDFSPFPEGPNFQLPKHLHSTDPEFEALAENVESPF